MSGIAGPTNPAWHEGQFGTQPGSSRNEGHQGELREEQEKIKQLQKFNFRLSYLIRLMLLCVSESIHVDVEKYCANIATMPDMLSLRLFCTPGLILNGLKYFV